MDDIRSAAMSTGQILLAWSKTHSATCIIQILIEFQSYFIFYFSIGLAVILPDSVHDPS